MTTPTTGDECDEVETVKQLAAQREKSLLQMLEQVLGADGGRWGGEVPRAEGKEVVSGGLEVQHVEVCVQAGNVRAGDEMLKCAIRKEGGCCGVTIHFFYGRATCVCAGFVIVSLCWTVSLFSLFAACFFAKRRGRNERRLAR